MTHNEVASHFIDAVQGGSAGPLPNTVRLDARAWARRLADTPPGERLAPVHPGEVLDEDFLKPGRLTKYRLAADTGLTPTHVGQIVAGARGVTAPVALRLAAYFGNSPEFWMRLQIGYDLETAAREMADELEALPRVEWDAAPGSPDSPRPKRLYRRRASRQGLVNSEKSPGRFS